MDSLERETQLDRRRWVEADLSEAQVDAGWEAVAARTRRAPRRSGLRLVAVSAVVAAAAGVALALYLAPNEPGAPSAWAGTSLVTGEEPMTVELADGSTIDARRDTRIELLEGSERTVRLALERGSARFEVTPNERRDFVVEADDVTVRVVGTAFTVENGGRGDTRHVEVTVDRGRVEVTTGGESRLLGAGETWSRRRTESVEVTSAEPAPEVEPELAPDDPRPPRRRVRTPRAPGPAELLQQATEARRAGQASEAADRYEELLSRHRGDSRAPLAAIELGRLRMDSLNDPAGAARAFELALELGPSSPLREDALARLVRANDAAGRTEACRDARRRYLESHPDGRWRAVVERRCGGD